jgi:FtsH ternary system-associated peptide
VPGGRIVSLVQRGLDLGLDVRYRIVRLHGLFEDGGPSWTVYEIGLQAPSSEVLPAAFIAGLDRDASVLVCRRVGPSLLIDHALSSALPDPHLAQVAELDDHTWVLASPDFGCHRLVAVGSGGYQDAAALVRLSDTYELTGPADRADNTDQPVVPVVLPVLRVVPATTRGVAIDALVLDDADLACLPTLLEGQPLAEVAFLARGRDRHLVLAPGGLLESLPLGEPLYRIGPGPLYLPLGHRLQPALPPAARRRFFPTDSDQAIALLRSDRAVAFDLVDCQPVWTLWTGPLPPIDLQIPADAIGGVVAVERALAASPETADFPGMKRGSRSARRQKITDSRPTDESDGWRDEAWRAERSGDLVAAAEIHEAHNDFRRAAHLYELAAREGRRGAL